MNQRGSIAILALWGVAIIAALLTAGAYAGRSEVAIARNSLAAGRARLAAEAGTQLGLLRLLRGRRDPAPQDWEDGDVAVRIAIADEAGKIDINQAPFELLAGLFTAAGRPRSEAELIACNVLARRGESAPLCPDAAGPSYRYAAPEELAQLPGFDGALYDRIADCVTVATGASAIDPRVAPRTVLLALPGATEGLVDAYLESRDVWHDLSGLDSAPAAAYAMASPQRDFTIAAVATVPRQARIRTDLQVRLTGLDISPYQVVAWREPPASRLP